MLRLECTSDAIMANLKPLEAWIAGWPSWVQTLWAGGSAFCVYFGMYAFRKTFKVGTWMGETWFNTGINLKVHSLGLGRLSSHSQSTGDRERVSRVLFPRARLSHALDVLTEQ